jgi:hypothetical protein
MVGMVAVRQGEMKQSDPIEEKIKLIKVARRSPLFNWILDRKTYRLSEA